MPMPETESAFIIPELFAKGIHPDQAEIWRGVLEAHGIASFVWHGLAGFPPLYPGPMQSCCLAVESDAIEEARAILEGTVPDGPPEGWEHVPGREIEVHRIGPPGPVMMAVVGLSLAALPLIFHLLVDFFDPGARDALSDIRPSERAFLLFAHLRDGVIGGLMFGFLLHPIGLAMRGSVPARRLLRVVAALSIPIWIVVG